MVLTILIKNKTRLTGYYKMYGTFVFKPFVGLHKPLVLLLMIFGIFTISTFFTRLAFSGSPMEADEEKEEEEEEAAAVVETTTKITKLPTSDAMPQHSIVVPGVVQGRGIGVGGGGGVGGGRGATSANYNDIHKHKLNLMPAQVNPTRHKQNGGIMLHDSLLLKQWLK